MHDDVVSDPEPEEDRHWTAGAGELTQGIALLPFKEYKGLVCFPFNITRDCSAFLLILQGIALTEEDRHWTAGAGEPWTAGAPEPGPASESDAEPSMTHGITGGFFGKIRRQIKERASAPPVSVFGSTLRPDAHRCTRTPLSAAVSMTMALPRSDCVTAWQ